ncbi:MAG: phosphodiesterase [Reyranella sp.]|uniref:phosphodiesterase n=1 Tax=Reyranella sp. TaxID=1929291 RepID=UPI003D0AD3FA
MMIAQITDMHVRPRGRLAYGRVDTNAMLAAAVATLEALPRKPDLVIATGDLTDCGLAEEYEVLRDILDPLSMPVYLVPGNHDRRAELLAEFGPDGYLPTDGGFLHYAVDGHPVRLIGLDTVVPGYGHGEMCAARLSWLEARLGEAPGRPTLIFMHHPPFGAGLADMDRINCRNGVAMAAVVSRFGNVERVLCGHHHRPITVRWAGTIGSVAPSTAHQVTLDLIPDESPASFTMEPPGLQLHLWSSTAGLVTHTLPIGTYEGPFPFVLDADYPGHSNKAEAA